MSTPNEMNEHQKKAFDFTNDLVKQILTISVAVITLAVGNLDHLAALHQNIWLGATFCLYTLSIVAGLMALMSLTGKLDIQNTNDGHKKLSPEAKAQKLKEINNKRTLRGQSILQTIPEYTAEDLSIYEPGISRPVFAQIVLFGAAILLTIIFALSGLGYMSEKPQKKVIIVHTGSQIDSLLLKDADIDSVEVHIEKAAKVKRSVKTIPHGNSVLMADSVALKDSSNKR